MSLKENNDGNGWRFSRRELYDNFKILEKEVKKKVCFQSVKSQDMNLRQQEHNISELAVGPWAMKHTT